MKIDCLGSGSSGNCYILEFNSGDIIILDAGVPFKDIKKALGYRRTKVKGVFITHEHGDHTRAVKDMIEDGMYLFMSEGTAGMLGIQSKPRVKTLTAGKKEIIEDYIHVMPLDAVHNAEQPFMYTVTDKRTDESLAFITDSSYVNYSFNKFNYLLFECNYISDIAKSQRSRGIYSHSENHMSLSSCVKLLEASDLSKCVIIILLHLSENNSDEKEMLETIKKVTGKKVDIADKGKSWNLSPDPF